MAETIYVRGEGGMVIAMDLPLPESIAERYERGQLARVHSDGSPYTTAVALAQEAPAAPAEPVDEPPAEPATGRGQRPGINAAKSEWIAYVVAQGLHSAEDAANYTKSDLIDMVS
ncbi:hypothetical protein [Streptomyces sp. TBY4]|uniref:hypothetical protein n=1 Tax=Streptomyces sp. TBY4 TaxID=2962030 RepID=UPI0020B86737|nr:hypothetical protein [Streptomyces sp. TBY4]MCP3758209.1 hypothetical protein [Streptomyces sp. TBY4]